VAKVLKKKRKRRKKSIEKSDYGIQLEEKQKLKGLNVLVLNALRRQEHISHFTLQQAIELIEELRPRKAYLTHLSHQMGLHHAVSKELPSNVELATDGLQLVL